MPNIRRKYAIQMLPAEAVFNRSMVGFMRAALTGVVMIVTDALCSARRRAMSTVGIKWPGASHGSTRKCGAWALDLEK
jgi:hypothetical protein